MSKNTPFFSALHRVVRRSAPTAVAGACLLASVWAQAQSPARFEMMVRAEGLVVNSDAAHLIFESQEGAPLTTLAFALTAAGSAQTATFYVKNTGWASASLSSATWSLQAPFSLDLNECASATLDKGERCAVTVRFAPPRGGDYSSPLFKAEATASTGTMLLPLLAKAPGSGARFEYNGVQTLALNHTLRQGESAYFSLSLYNNGDVPLLVYASGLSVSGTVPYFHGYTNNNCSTSSTTVTVPVGQRCSVAYRMNAYVHNSGGASSSAPVNVGTYNVTLSVSNSNLTTPSTLPVAVTVTARASETLSTNKVQVTGAAKTGAYVCYTKFSGTYGGVMSDYFCGGGYGYTYAGSGESHCSACKRYTE